jgi:hypothetical protein
MSALTEGDEAMRRAGWITGRSVIATIADGVVRPLAASVRSSSALMTGRRGLRAFRSLPPAERTRCVLIALTAALAGHIFLAALLPPAASPSIALTTVAFLGAALMVAPPPPQPLSPLSGPKHFSQTMNDAVPFGSVITCSRCHPRRPSLSVPVRASAST